MLHLRGAGARAMLISRFSKCLYTTVLVGVFLYRQLRLLSEQLFYDTDPLTQS
jgi:hypothetical protein